LAAFAIIVPPAGNPPSGIPLGYQRALQAVIADPYSSIDLTLTAATRITVIQGPTVTNLPLGDESTAVVSVPQMPIPFYGTNYTSLWVSSNGYISFGTSNNDYTPSESEFVFGPPRMAGFWTDLAQIGGTITATVDTPQNGNPGYVRIDFADVQEGYGVGIHHWFSMLCQTDGYLEIIYPSSQNASGYDEITGIGPGATNPAVTQAQKNFVGSPPLGSNLLPGILTTPPFVFLGTTNLAFFEWYGTTNGSMPYYGNTYDNPFDLFARTLHFSPNASGNLPAQTLSYTLF
jgi:hypothetical protein